MDPVAEIVLWTVLFLGTHFILSSAAIRDRLVAAVGAQPFRGIYSVIALATFIPLVIVFARHKHAGVMLWYLRGYGAVRGLTWLLMFVALILFVAGLINPNPGAIGAPSSNHAHGILKITRHPSFVAIAIFGLAHLLMNGWAGDVIFFGSFPVLGILGGIHQDRRKLRELGEPYRELMATTSIFPGAALWSGRAKWSSGDMPWAGIGVGIAVTIIIVIFHPWIFGGSPMG
ncbi:MAG TPA: NnrU family protein [Candidatus Binataceae bacterium]|nr:NnrU family protein [Candidatus Binataceae bacterium]